MRRFKHLTWTDRLRIEKWLNEGMKPKDIASKLRVHISTVYNELHRGEYQRLVGDTWEFVSAYSPDIAEQKYQAHLRDKGPALKIGKDHELANYIETTILNKECSPAAVFGYAQQEGKQFKTSVSVQTGGAGSALHGHPQERRRSGPESHSRRIAPARETQAGI